MSVRGEDKKLPMQYGLMIVPVSAAIALALAVGYSQYNANPKGGADTLEGLLFRPEEVAAFNGEEGLPTYLCILGEVFDVRYRSIPRSTDAMKHVSVAVALEASIMVRAKDILGLLPKTTHEHSSQVQISKCICITVGIVENCNNCSRIICVPQVTSRD
jgi:predicted heme/steroid binding protein